MPGEVANFSTSFQGPDTTAKIFISALGKLRQNKLELSILSPFSLAFLNLVSFTVINKSCIVINLNKLYENKLHHT